MKLYRMDEAVTTAEFDSTATWPWNEILMDQGTGPATAGKVVALGADPGTGKSWYCLHVAKSSPFPSLYVSLEETLVDIGRRAKHMDISDRVFVTDEAYTFPQVLAAIHKGHAEHGIRTAFIDYLQLLDYEGSRRTGNRTEDIRAILIELQACAKQLDITIVLVCQLKELPAGMDRSQPTPSDIAESAHVRRMAWAVVLLWSLGRKHMCAVVAKAKGTESGTRAFYERGKGGALVWCPKSNVPAHLLSNDTDEAF